MSSVNNSLGVLWALRAGQGKLLTQPYSDEKWVNGPYQICARPMLCSFHVVANNIPKHIGCNIRSYHLLAKGSHSDFVS